MQVQRFILFYAMVNSSWQVSQNLPMKNKHDFETLLCQVNIVKKLWKTMETERWLDLQTFEHFHLKIGQNNFQNKILFCWIVNCSWYSGNSMSRWALSFLNSLTYYALANNLTFFEGQPAQHVAQHPHIWAWGIFEIFHVFFL